MLKLTFDSGFANSPEMFISPRLLIAARSRPRGIGALVCLHPILEERLPTGGDLDHVTSSLQEGTRWYAVKESLAELQKAMKPPRPRPAKKPGQVFG